MTSKTYAFLIFLFFFHCLIAALGFFPPFIKPCTHTDIDTYTQWITQCHFHSDKIHCCPDKFWAGGAALAIFLSPSFAASLLEGAESEEGGTGNIRPDLMSNRTAAFFVNTCQIKSANEAIVVAGNWFYTQLKECLLGGTERLPPEIY